MSNVTELAIVKKIMELLKLGEAGKIGNFFSKQVKNSEKAIRDLKRNKTTLKNSYEDNVEDLNDQLVDAKEAVSDAYMNVSVDNVKTNAAMANFEIEYWAGVRAAEALVDELENKLEVAKEEYEEEVKDLDEQIAAYQTRIDRLTKE